MNKGYQPTTSISSETPDCKSCINISQEQKALQGNDFRTLEDLLPAYHQVKAERDLALACLKEAAATTGDCSYCSHLTENEDACIENDCGCDACHAPCRCKECQSASHWEFAGSTKVEHKGGNAT